MKPTLIICLGNPLMRDEGIGVRLASELSQRLADNPKVEVLDLGTGGLTIMHAIVAREKVIFVDCALMGEAPGVMRRFTPRDVVSKKIKTRYSVHEGDLLEVLKLSTDMGECPDDIVIFGIEPRQIDHGQGLSEELKSNLPHYTDTILKELGITSTK